MTEPFDLAAEVRRLSDIEAVKRLKARYFRCIDTANLRELAELLTEDVTASLIGGSYRVELQGIGEYLAMIENAFHAEFVGHHNGHHPEIDILSDREATGIWYLSDIAHDLRRGVSTIGAALYRDRYVKTDGIWRIRHTEYERLYEIVEPFTKGANLTAHYLASHGKRLKG